MKKRILFVDDEPNILSSMKRMLRGLRKTVTMDFMESGRMALEAMAKEPYDVVVSDMRMPGMDGAEFLSLIRDRWPCTIRIMLTGQADSGSMLRTVNVVHTFLMKPCEQDEIKKTILRGCDLHSFLSEGRACSAECRSVSGGLTLPEVYQDLQEVLLGDGCTNESLAECLRRDQWLYDCVLQLFHVVRESASGETITIVEAIQALGHGVLRPLILSLHLFRELLDQDLVEKLSLEKVLIHGMRVAQYARKIAEAEQVKMAMVTDALIGGLLHDIGYLMLARSQPEKYVEVVRDLLESGVAFDLCEEDIFSFTHNRAGALLLVMLGFPLGIIEIVAYHTDLSRHPDSFFNGLTAVHVADSLVGGIDNSSCCFSSLLARDYLQRVQCEDRLPVWEEILSV